MLRGAPSGVAYLAMSVPCVAPSRGTSPEKDGDVKDPLAAEKGKLVTRCASEMRD